MKTLIVIPAYNEKDNIERVVDNLTANYPQFDYVVVNDGSKDNTKAVCNVLAETHSQVKCIHKDNGGVSSARNRGIDEAKGEYILFMDADDTYKPKGFADCCKIIDTVDFDMITFGLSFDYYKNNSVYRSDVLIYPEEGLLTPSQWSEDFTTLFHSNSLSSSCNKIFKTRIIKENKLYFNKNIFLMEDFLFVLAYLKYTQNIYCIKDALYHYRQPDNENHAFTRMNRIPEFNDYLVPFYLEMESLKESLNELYELPFTQGEEVLFALYKMLISQKAYYADTKTLKSLSQTVKNGRFAAFDTDDILINDLKNENYKAIIKRHKKIQLRHKIAVKVKKTAIYQKLRGN